MLVKDKKLLLKEAKVSTTTVSDLKLSLPQAGQYSKNWSLLFTSAQTNDVEAPSLENQGGDAVICWHRWCSTCWGLENTSSHMCILFSSFGKKDDFLSIGRMWTLETASLQLHPVFTLYYLHHAGQVSLHFCASVCGFLWVFFSFFMAQQQSLPITLLRSLCELIIELEQLLAQSALSLIISEHCHHLLCGLYLNSFVQRLTLLRGLMMLRTLCISSTRCRKSRGPTLNTCGTWSEWNERGW